MVGIDRNMSLISVQGSGNTFYFRSRIPSDLREHFGGMKEFRLSLKCAIKSRSIKISRVLDRKVLRLYETIRQGMKPLTIEEIKEILRIEIRKQILHAHHVYDVDAVRRLLGQSSVTATSAYLGTSDESSLDLARTINI